MTNDRTTTENENDAWWPPARDAPRRHDPHRHRRPLTRATSRGDPTIPRLARAAAFVLAAQLRVQGRQLRSKFARRREERRAATGESGGSFNFGPELPIFPRCVRTGPRRRWTTRVVAGCLAAVTVFLLVAFGVLINDAKRDARDALDARFQTRASLTARFARDFIDDLAARERTQAERLLAAPTVSQPEFEQVVAAFDFEAAVLLDQNGRLLQVWPARPDMLGRDMTVDYAHLRTAVDGEVGVSGSVPSAAQSIPITAVAVPFDTPAGRRVFSGAFSAAAAPIGSYMNSVVPITGGSGFLIDQTGHVLAGTAGPGTTDAVDFAGKTDGIVAYDTGDSTSMTAAIASVDGTPWRVVLVAPSEGLHAPLNGPHAWTSWALLAVLAACSAVSIALLLRLGSARAEAAALSRTDLLTGLPNRRAMAEALDRAIVHSARYGEPLAVCLIDLDHFKSINDRFGHDAGDEALRLVGAALRKVTRGDDLAGRWGGEEFIVVLSHADRDGALLAAERIRHAISQITLPLPNNAHGLTASVGVALSDGPIDEGASLVPRADTALYTAKAGGRDQVVLSNAAGTNDFALHEIATTEGLDLRSPRSRRASCSPASPTCSSSSAPSATARASRR